jgi:hypothetical protein
MELTSARTAWFTEGRRPPLSFRTPAAQARPVAMIPNIRSEPAAGPPPIDTPPSAPVDVVVVDVPGRPGRRRDLRLTVRQSHARVADLAAAVGLRGAAALCVDGLPHPAERPLAVVGLRRGATIAGVATGADGALT